MGNGGVLSHFYHFEFSDFGGPEKGTDKVTNQTVIFIIFNVYSKFTTKIYILQNRIIPLLY